MRGEGGRTRRSQRREGESQGGSGEGAAGQVFGSIVSGPTFASAE